MESPKEPRFDLAKKVLPEPLLRSLLHVFSQRLEGCALAGGSALAGFFAGHRRSDDLDLFTQSELHQRATALAVRSLSQIGATLDNLLETNHFFSVLCRLSGRSFTVTSALDINLFRMGRVMTLDHDVRVVDLVTLLKMKAATLASRCSEKDLYDLIWLFREFKDLTYPDLIRLGSEIDGGVKGEALLIGISGATLKKEACGFALDPKISKEEIFNQITAFQKNLLRVLSLHLRNQPAPLLRELVQKVSQLKPSRKS